MATPASTLTAPPGFPKEEFLEIKAIQNTPDTSQDEFKALINPFIPQFLELLKRVDWQQFTMNFTIPYQIIGGYAVSLIQSQMNIPNAHIPSTSDIDVELGALVQRSPSGFVIVPFSTGDTVNPLYLSYGGFLLQTMSTTLGQLLTSPQFQEILPHLESPNPLEDDEAKHQHPEMNIAIGPFHISVIYNLKYIPKILVFTKYKGAHQHIVDIQFPRENRVIQGAFISSFGVFVANMIELLEKNALSIINRHRKKMNAEDKLQSLLISKKLQTNPEITARTEKMIEEYKSYIIRISTKVLNHSLRFIYLLLAIHTYRTTSPRVVGALELLFNPASPQSILAYKFEDYVPRIFNEFLTAPENVDAFVSSYGSLGPGAQRVEDIRAHIRRFDVFVEALRAELPPAPKVNGTRNNAQRKNSVNRMNDVLNNAESELENLDEEEFRESPAEEAIQTYTSTPELQEQTLEESIQTAKDVVPEISLEERARLQAEKAKAKRKQRRENRKTRKQKLLQNKAREEKNIEEAIRLAEEQKKALPVVEPSKGPLEKIQRDYNLFLLKEPPSVGNTSSTLSFGNDPNNSEKELKLKMTNRTSLTDLMTYIDMSIENPTPDLENIHIFYHTLPNIKLRFFVNKPSDTQRVLYESVSMYTALNLLGYMEQTLSKFHENYTIIYITIQHLYNLVRKFRHSGKLPEETLKLITDTIDDKLDLEYTRRIHKEEIEGKTVLKKEIPKSMLQLYDNVLYTLADVISILLEYELFKYPESEIIKRREELLLSPKYPITRKGIRDTLQKNIESCKYTESRAKKLAKYVQSIESAKMMNMKVLLLMRTAIILRHVDVNVKELTISNSGVEKTPNVYLFIPYLTALVNGIYENAFLQCFTTARKQLFELPQPNIQFAEFKFPELHASAIELIKSPSANKLVLDYNCYQLLDLFEAIVEKSSAKSEEEITAVRKNCAGPFIRLYQFERNTMMNVPILKLDDANHSMDIFSELKTLLSRPPKDESDRDSYTKKLMSVVFSIVKTFKKNSDLLTDVDKISMEYVGQMDIIPKFMDTTDYTPLEGMSKLLLTALDLEVLREFSRMAGGKRRKTRKRRGRKTMK